MKTFILPIIIFIVAGVLWNPSGTFMPTAMVKLLLVLLVAAFGTYAVFFFLERPRDEREAMHALMSDKLALFGAGTVILGGIVVGELEHTPHRVLLLALFTLVLCKSIGKAYFDRVR